jgi:tetrapyrrole methylase family protein/MazG family protein
MKNKIDALTAFQKLVEVVAHLRDPEKGCPWDKEQTHQSLKPYVIEETYEVLEAIDLGPEELCKELGDLLLQVMLHAQIAKDEGTFEIGDVISGITEKMVERHPHVFGDKKLHSSDEVLKNWEATKQKKLEKDQSILDGVPKIMPALLRSQRIGEKAARVGFEWDTVEEVRDKVFEEMNEFLQSIKNGSKESIEDEFGDILFSLTQLARRLKLNSEDLLNRSCNKFIGRFKKIEKLADGKMKDMSLTELDALWEKVKAEEKNQ